MREHSGADGGKNNNRNPTLKEAERRKGTSGEAITGDKAEKRKGGERLTTVRP